MKLRIRRQIALRQQKAFHEMTEASVTTAIMEVSSHALELGRVHGCDYDIAVFTNLTQDHLDFHKTMDRYRQAKSLFFSQLGNAYIENRPKYAVLNADDEATADFIKATLCYSRNIRHRQRSGYQGQGYTN